MATIQTKYSVGDVVYHAATTTERKQHPCPDCSGSRQWEAHSPAGGAYAFPCPRCAARYNSDRDMALDYTAHVSNVSKLTIGSIRHDSKPWGEDAKTSYMCRETGVGSGSVYDEGRLFETEEQALHSATIIAAKANAETEWIVTLYNKSLEISDYQIENAALKLAKDEKSAAHSLIWNIGDLFATIAECDDKDAILEAVDDYKRFNLERDKAKAKKMEAA